MERDSHTASSQEKKTMLITGSSRGIGLAVARLASERGYEVILHGRTETAQLQAVARELNAPYIYCDVSNEAEVKAKLQELGRKVDVLVNNAGINLSNAFEEIPSEDWLRMFQVNVLGTVNFSKAVLPGMKERKQGRIVNIASIKGYQHTVGRVGYASSKAAIINITSGMAKEFAPHIAVNAVAPGFTNTEMTEDTWSERIQQQVNNILLKRMAHPKEIAEAVLFLAGEQSSYITGQTLVVDGGFYIKND